MSVRRFLAPAAACVVTLALVAFAAPRAEAGNCSPLSPAQMFLDPDYSVPEGDPRALVVQMSGPDTLTIPPSGGAVTAIQVGPPVMVLPEDAFVAGVDFDACIDAETGEGHITFNVAAPFFVRVTYADAHVDHFFALVETKYSGDGPAETTMQPALPKSDASFREVSGVPQGTHVFADADFSGEPSGAHTVTSLVDLITELSSLSGANVALRYHGTGNGSFKIGSTEIRVGTREFASLCSALGSGHVSNLTLLTCWGGAGSEGQALLNALKACIGGGSVSGSTGMVSSTWRGTKFHFVHNGTQVSAGP